MVGVADSRNRAFERPQVELSDRHPIFIGFKMDGSLRRQLDSLEGADQRYVSRTDSPFLRICTKNGDSYVGKVVDERLSTSRLDDVRRNIYSILNRLCPDTRFPEQFEIWACVPEEPEP